MGKLTIRSLYLYAVSFATLMMIIFGTVNLIMSVVELAYPEPGWGLTKSEIMLDKIRTLPREGGEISEQEMALIEKQAEEQLQREEDNRKFSRVRRVAQAGAMLVVAVPIYLYHWKQVQKKEGEEAR
ncbi:MAG TPA: hypothetical protein GXX38_02045 [Clostridia bacterium]|nr:hypothetical protein [Clostridia bacterium]